MIRNITFFLFILVFFTCCNKSEDYLLIIDTSGSMKKNGQLELVKKSIKKILLQCKSNDRIHLITFNSKVKSNTITTVDNNQSLIKLFEFIDQIKADGKWTNLIGALDTSLKSVEKIHKENPDKKITLILYTDGKHDLPKDHKDNQNLNFNDLFNKYYQAFDPNKPSWYIYYVRLDHLDSNLGTFLKKTKSGKIITPEIIKAKPNFLLEEYDLKIIFTWLGIIVFGWGLLHTILFFIRPWFKNSTLKCVSAKSYGTGHPLSFDLSDFSKNFFRNYIIIGSSGDIPIMGSEINPRHAALGVTLFGRIYIRPISGSRIRINNVRVHRRKIISEGDKIQIGLNDFTIESKYD